MAMPDGARREVLQASQALEALCEKIYASLSLPSALEVLLLKLACRYAEVENDQAAQIPEMYEPLETAIARLQHNVRVSMLEYRRLRTSGMFGPDQETRD